MSSFNTIAILVVAYLAVFAQATFNEFRQLFGVQIDLLPSLVVYASLSSGVVISAPGRTRMPPILTRRWTRTA